MNNFTFLSQGQPICITFNGKSQTGFFISINQQFVTWGANFDNQARLVFTPINAIKSLVPF